MMDRAIFLRAGFRRASGDGEQLKNYSRSGSYEAKQKALSGHKHIAEDSGRLGIAPTLVGTFASLKELTPSMRISF